MTATLMQFSTVVVGESHNPSILNPDFLAAQDIVPANWNWQQAETVTTPPFSLVRYENGVSITVEPNKLQVVDGGVNIEPSASNAAIIATAYVKALPHVRYAAVGINFQTVIANASPEGFLKNRFLKNGTWDSSVRALHAVGLRLVYVLPDEARVTLSIDPGDVSRTADGDKQRAVIVRANFTRECRTHPSHEQVVAHLKQVSSDWATYQSLLAETVGAED